MTLENTILVTGGAGFIGANFVLDVLGKTDANVVNLDALTYAGNPESLARISQSSRYRFVHGDIGNRDLVASLLRDVQPRAVVNFAAESHVDRSIVSPDTFIRTNVQGTFQFLDEVRLWWRRHPSGQQDRFRFLHVSTDEVFGSLKPTAPAFTESTQFAPNSPYAASKAASDHFVRAYRETYGLPTITTNCSNNYGPLQFPEKLIPLMITNALAGRDLPVYGDGQNMRDWLYVEDHCSALLLVLDGGVLGATYNIGGNSEQSNLSVVKSICESLDAIRPLQNSTRYDRQIRFVPDRPGHDRRYAIDATRIRTELGWVPKETFATGLEKTIRWYVANQSWVGRILSGEYSKWIEQHYGSR